MMVVSAGPCGPGPWIGYLHDEPAAALVPDRCRAGLGCASGTEAMPHLHPCRPEMKEVNARWNTSARGLAAGIRACRSKTALALVLASFLLPVVVQGAA